MYKIAYLCWKDDYYRYLYKHCYSKDRNDIYWIEHPEFFLKGLQNTLFCMHNSYRTNSFINLPFKKVWAKDFFKSQAPNKIDKDAQVCFMVPGGNAYQLIHAGVLDYIYCNYPNSKICLQFGDKIDLYRNRYHEFDIEFLKDKFDIVSSYNNEDVSKYGLIWTPPTIFDYDSSLFDSTPPVDVFFLGRDKGRLDSIINIYELCKQQGLLCDFNIVGVEESKRKLSNEINYISYMSYEENLKHVSKAKCILNIVQEGSSGITMRDYEAIGLNKIVMTNNDSMFKSDLYTASKVIDIANLENEFVKIARFNAFESWNNKQKYSYLQWRKWLEINLRNKERYTK